MTTINIEIQKPETNPYVELYELDLNPIGENQILRWTPNVNENGTSIVFNGNTYVPLDIRVEGIEYSGQGRPPTPKIFLPGTVDALAALINSFNGLSGAKFTRIRTFSQWLGAVANPQSLRNDVFIVDRIANQNKYTIEIELTSVIDQTNSQLPKRTLNSDYCPWVYRKRVNGQFVYHPTDKACPYSGTTYYDENNVLTVNPDLDKCSKNLQGCRVRFGNDAVLPFGGFPGTSRPTT